MSDGSIYILIIGIFGIGLCLCYSASEIKRNVVAWGIEMLYFSCQTDRAAMLDEILDYVKFLRLQVKVICRSL